MRLKIKILSGLIICIASGMAVMSYNSFNKTRADQDDNMFFTAELQQTSIEEIKQTYPEYVYTAELLEKLGKSPEYISRCLSFAKAASLTLDPFFLGNFYSPNKDVGYSEELKSSNFAMLQALIAQQFPNATKQAEPVYTTYPGAPGVGEPFHLEADFNIDVMHNKFPQNAIIVGPDLVVMTQMKTYREACAMPKGEARTAAMIKAYSDARDFSNGATNLMLAMAIVERLNVIHDSTMTSPIAGQVLDAVKAQKYQVHGKIFLTDKNTRISGLIARQDKYDGFTLATPEDTAAKGTLSFEKIADKTYTTNNRFDVLSVYVQPEGFVTGKPAVEIARLDANTGEIYALPEGKAELDRLLSKLELENLKPEIKAAFMSVIQEWEATQPSQQQRVSNVNKL